MLVIAWNNKNIPRSVALKTNKSLKSLGVILKVKIILLFFCLFSLSIVLDITMYMLTGMKFSLKNITNHFEMMSSPEFIILFALLFFLLMNPIVAHFRKSKAK